MEWRCMALDSGFGRMRTAALAPAVLAAAPRGVGRRPPGPPDPPRGAPGPPGRPEPPERVGLYLGMASMTADAHAASSPAPADSVSGEISEGGRSHARACASAFASSAWPWR